MELRVIFGWMVPECVNYEVHGRNHLFITILRLMALGGRTIKPICSLKIVIEPLHFLENFTYKNYRLIPKIIIMEDLILRNLVE